MESNGRVRFVKFIWVALVMVLLVGITSCKDDSNDIKKESPPLLGNAYVNAWIYKNMDIYYLWKDEIPSKPDTSLAPDEFFKTLLSNEDRFSWIQEDYLELLNSLQGVNKEAGYELKLYRESENNENVIAQVMYIKTGSIVDAQDLDLMRGDVITQVNGQSMTLSNYQNVLGGLGENHTIKYSRFNSETEDWEDKGTLALTTAEFAENPNFLNRVIEVGNGRRVGYYLYNFFATGKTSKDNEYNVQMDAIFSEFKTQNITDLVLDLRYNSGGAEGATINLASLIGSGIDGNDVFTRREYNPELQDALIAAYGSSFVFKNFTDKSQNIGSLTNNRVYILTSSRTASASELLINGLKPFMDVFLIGSVTVGKNVGSISLYEDNDPKNAWGLQPIVVKSYNSLNQSAYSNGFEPNILDLDNDLVLLPLGDENEALLSLAIDHITGGSGAKKSVIDRKSYFETLGTSADIKRGSYNLVIDDKELQQALKSILIE